MTLDDIPLFALMKSKLGYNSQREKLISQNVANADTPGYSPKDLKAFTITSSTGLNTSGSLSMVQPARTEPGHLAPPAAMGPSAQWRSYSTADSETKLDGNKVSVEDEMSKMTQSRMDYEAVIGFYEKAIEMYRISATPPGKVA
jgi:flagellar basal-body rod protein FlgB